MALQYVPLSKLNGRSKRLSNDVQSGYVSPNTPASRTNTVQVLFQSSPFSVCSRFVLFRHLYRVFFFSFHFISTVLVYPFVITIATDKNQAQRIGLANVGLKENRFTVVAIGTLDILTSCQGGIVRYGRGYGMQNISHFPSEFIPINQGLIGSRLGVSTQSTCVLEYAIGFVFL